MCEDLKVLTSSTRLKELQVLCVAESRSRGQIMKGATNTLKNLDFILKGKDSH